MDGLSNFAIWKARILVVLEAYSIREHAEKILEKHNEATTHAKRFIMDGVKDHVVPHIADKKTAHEMWVALTTLYEGRCFWRTS